MKTSLVRFLGLAVLGLTLTATNHAALQVRIGDLTFPLGSRDNQLVGYGLVYGLANDGDKDTTYTKQAYANTLLQFGLSVNKESVSSKNVAAVIVIADIPPNAKKGSRITVTVAAAGDSKSLQGGLLAQTPLLGADGRIYAVAQGALAVGGFALGNSGPGGASVQKNHPTTGSITDGALVENDIKVTLDHDGYVKFVLRNPSFSNAARMAEEINKQYATSSVADDAGIVKVKIPENYRNALVRFVADLQDIKIIPDVAAKVIINERTGTIVATGSVKLTAGAVAHGNLLVSIAETQDVSQPSPFAQVGQTQVTTTTTTGVTEEKARMLAFPEMPSIERVADLLNRVGATPRDMMSIFEALSRSGILQAKLEIN